MMKRGPVVGHISLSIGIVSFFLARPLTPSDLPHCPAPEAAKADLLGWKEVEFVGDNRVRGRDPSDGRLKLVPDWVFDLKSSFQLEDALGAAGLWDKYISALRNGVAPNGGLQQRVGPKIMHATPMQRATAALSVLTSVCDDQLRKREKAQQK
jgi:hypothetical protein